MAHFSLIIIYKHKLGNSLQFSPGSDAIFILAKKKKLILFV